MEYVYAALMLNSAKKDVNEENVKKIIQSIGLTPDDAKVKALIASLEGVDIEDAIKQAAVAVAAPAGEEKKEEESEEEKAEEESKKAESAAAGLGALFG